VPAQNGAADDSTVPPPPLTFELSKDANGRLLAFPFLVDGQFYQAEVKYSGTQIGVIKVGGNGMPASEVTFIEYRNELPYLARIAAESTGNEEITANTTDAASGAASSAASSAASPDRAENPGVVYSFAAFKWFSDECIELWTTAEGLPLAVFGGADMFHYDSMNNITYIKDEKTETSAVYNARGVRYWKKDGTQYEFQRDGHGLITRLVEIPVEGGEAPEAGELLEALEPPVDYRYEYTLLEGALWEGSLWTERREFRFSEFNGYLAAAGGDIVRRTITR
jgi:hypothetical protein